MSQEKALINTDMINIIKQEIKSNKEIKQLMGF